jgi:hypothetical protein
LALHLPTALTSLVLQLPAVKALCCEHSRQKGWQDENFHRQYHAENKETNMRRMTLSAKSEPQEYDQTAHKCMHAYLHSPSQQCQ